MNTPKQSRQAGTVQAIAVGFIALVLLSIPLYWGRFFCEMGVVEQISGDVSKIVISPSGIVPPEIENDPNVAIHSRFEASMLTNRIVLLGIADYLLSRMPEGPYSNVYYFTDKLLLYFDKNSGLFVYEYTGQQAATGGKTVPERVKLFAGPEGVSPTIDKTLGRFLEPIRPSFNYNRTLFITYDKKERRFFKIDFDSRTVTKGPKVKDEKNYNPLRTEDLYNYYSISLFWKPPLTEVKNVDANNYDERKGLQNIKGGYYKPVMQYAIGRNQKYLLVLDKSGRIDLLDRQSLEIAGTAGHLPAPEGYFPAPEGFPSLEQTAAPRDLFDYQVLPLSFPNDEQYRGMYAAAISREGINMAVAVFDSNGMLIQNTEENLYKLRSRNAYLSSSPSSTLTIAKYLLENLHPPILSAASYLTADAFDAKSGHRAMFLLPNSFVAMMARQIDKMPQQKIGGAFLLMLPSIILSVFLARLVSRDAAVRGLSKKAKQWWVIAVAAFGLPAYISYRLTRPAITLVTCQNCGFGRRPDMEACHRCGSKWFVPELVPPDWRVAD